MKVNTAAQHGQRESQSHTAISKAIDWLQNYIDEHPYTGAADQARSILKGLQAVRARPALDDLLALIGEISKTDQGLQEISRAKARLRQTGERI